LRRALSPPEAGSPVRVGRSHIGLIVVLGALTAFGPMSVDMYLPAFPSLARHFATSIGTVQLTLPSYMAGLALGQLLYGRLSDTYGRRRPMLAGVGVYVLCSAACALAPSIETLIALRLLQGFAGCAGIVIARAVVRDMFAGAEAARFFALLMLVFGVAPVLAPLLGGQLLPLVGWKGIFLTLAGYGAVCLGGVLWLPETLPAGLRRPPGLADALSSYWDVLRHREFAVYALAGALGSAAMLAYIATAPALVIDEYGLSPQSFGLVFGGNAVGFVAVSQITAAAVRRFGSERMLRIGLIVQSLAGATLLAIALAGVGGLALILPVVFVIVGSMGAIMPTATALALQPFPHSAGAAAAVVGTLQTALAAAAGVIVSSVTLGPAAAMAAVTTAASATAILLLLLGIRQLAARPGPELGVESLAEGAPLA
jgi:MFS transporter, DHA1 family, multidrug resistance protein